MATLRYSQIRAHAGGTLRYIANPDKIVSAETDDIYHVLSYMAEPKSVSRVYSFSRHCSQNVDLAEKQIAIHRERYYENKSGGVQGLAEGKQELLGLHFFFSYTEEDDPNEEVMNEIAMKIVEHSKLKDFAVFGANHFDQAHKHTHFFVSAYSAEGKPRKLCLRKSDYDDIRRYANGLCVERGLSIIDLTALRYKNPEYSDWVDNVIAEGKVVVHPEKEEHKRQPKQKIPTRNLYYKWKQENAEQAEENGRLLTEIQRKKKDFESKYYYTPDSDPNRRWYVTGDVQERFYTISRVSRDGYQRTELEMQVRFVLFVAEHEGMYIRKNDVNLWFQYHAQVDEKLQGLADCLRTANEMCIENPGQIADRIADVGKQMNALRQEKARHERSIVKQGQIIEAYETYNRIRNKVEREQEPEPEVMEEYKEAYAILAQNQVLTAEAYEKLCRRREFEMQKTVDYGRRMPELGRQYHQLKRLEAVTANPKGMLQAIYGYSLLAFQRTEGNEVDRLIYDARARTDYNKRDGQTKER